jgi:DNA-binding transcriptional ArsR family regulator
VRGEVVLLAQHDLGAAAGEVAGDAGAVDAAADDADVAGPRRRLRRRCRRLPVRRCPSNVRFVSFPLFSFRFNRLSGKRKRGFPPGRMSPARLASRSIGRRIPNAMTPNPRQALLLDEVRERGSATVEALAEQFGVTLQTVRRDVKLLADAGLLARFHGGVRLPGSTTENIAYRQRQHLNRKAKRRIARAVAAAVPPGARSSSTSAPRPRRSRRSCCATRACA